YDLAGRLTAVRLNGALQALYSYDANGNRITVQTQHGETTATYDAQDRLVQYGDASYTYTRSGELATRTADGQTTTYTYDTLGNFQNS
ncbi:MAG: RHS repeat protein, partial [Longimicrobiales bacterium]